MPPVSDVNILLSPAAPVEGELFTLTLSWTDPAPSSVTVIIVYNDGTQTVASSVSPYIDSHTYDAGTHTINATVQWSDTDKATASTTITVANVPPTITTAIAHIDDKTGIATATITWTDPGLLDTFNVSLDWGDGNTSRVSGISTRTQTFNHVYSIPLPPLLLTATVTDDDAASDVVSFSPSVTYHDHVSDVAYGSTVCYGVVLYSDTIGAIAYGDASFDGTPFYSMTGSSGIAYGSFDVNGIADYTSVLILPQYVECAKVGAVPFESLITYDPAYYSSFDYSYGVVVEPPQPQPLIPDAPAPPPPPSPPINAPGTVFTPPSPTSSGAHLIISNDDPTQYVNTPLPPSSPAIMSARFNVTVTCAGRVVVNAVALPWYGVDVNQASVNMVSQGLARTPLVWVMNVPLNAASPSDEVDVTLQKTHNIDTLGLPTTANPHIQATIKGAYGPFDIVNNAILLTTLSGDWTVSYKCHVQDIIGVAG